MDMYIIIYDVSFKFLMNKKMKNEESKIEIVEFDLLKVRFGLQKLYLIDRYYRNENTIYFSLYPLR